MESKHWTQSRTIAVLVVALLGLLMELGKAVVGWIDAGHTLSGIVTILYPAILAFLTGAGIYFRKNATQTLHVLAVLFVGALLLSPAPARAAEAKKVKLLSVERVYPTLGWKYEHTYRDDADRDQQVWNVGLAYGLARFAAIQWQYSQDFDHSESTQSLGVVLNLRGLFFAKPVQVPGPVSP